MHFVAQVQGNDPVKLFRPMRRKAVARAAKHPAEQGHLRRVRSEVGVHVIDSRRGQQALQRRRFRQVDELLQPAPVAAAAVLPRHPQRPPEPSGRPHRRQHGVLQQHKGALVEDAHGPRLLLLIRRIDKIPPVAAYGKAGDFAPLLLQRPDLPADERLAGLGVLVDKVGDAQGCYWLPGESWSPIGYRAMAGVSSCFPPGSEAGPLELPFQVAER